MTPDDFRIRHYLSMLYGEDESAAVWRQLDLKLQQFSESHPELRDPSHLQPLTQKDVMLITYGDQVREPGRQPLKTLGDFLRAHLDQVVTDVHILPFYPYSSDDGFSVVDYLQVNPELGSWEDIRALGQEYRLMFDGVINHISRQSEWFQGFLNGETRYKDYFITLAPDTDLSQVFRPRALPLMAPVETSQGIKYVWTTFSEDQIDLNYANPAVLLGMLDVLLYYVANQACFLRLDAIAFLWKTVGTSCVHLPQTHAVIKLLRVILDQVAPGVLLITETNVPHRENISYFGDGRDEAQLVYNFALPPLVLHSFFTGNARALSKWAASLKLPSDHVTFFNFLASHDGIGITPARGILSQPEMDALVSQVERHQGLISYRNMPDGSQVPYELNINYFDALSDPGSDESLDTQVDRFVAAHAIMFAMQGVPGIYFHSLFGSRSWVEGAAKSGIKRAINRQKLERQELEDELSNPLLPRAKTLSRLKALLKARAGSPAFDPYARQQVLDIHPAVFAIVRGEPGKDQVLCLHNVSNQTQEIVVHLSMLGEGEHKAQDLLSSSSYTGGKINLTLKPYQAAWLSLDINLAGK